MYFLYGENESCKRWLPDAKCELGARGKSAILVLRMDCGTRKGVAQAALGVDAGTCYEVFVQKRFGQSLWAKNSL